MFEVPATPGSSKRRPSWKTVGIIMSSLCIVLATALVFVFLSSNRLNKETKYKLESLGYDISNMGDLIDELTDANRNLEWEVSNLEDEKSNLEDRVEELEDIIERAQSEVEDLQMHISFEWDNWSLMMDANNIMGVLNEY